MKSIGPQCYQLRLSDETGEWRLILQITDDKVRPLHVFQKKSQKTPKRAIE